LILDSNKFKNNTTNITNYYLKKIEENIYETKL